MRERINFDRAWDFYRGDINLSLPREKRIVYREAKTERALRGPASRGYDTSGEGWRRVDLPHDYVIEEEVSRDGNEGLGFYPYRNAWYVKKFRLSHSDADKRLTLFFEGVATHATVYLNGCLLKHNFCGYTEFEVDITDVADLEGENTLSVYVSTEQHEGWWYEGGGIYRHVWLIKTDLISVDLYGAYADASKISDGLWRVGCEITLRNDGYKRERARVVCDILDRDGAIVSTGDCGGYIDPQSKRVLKLPLEVTSPTLWSPDTPALYTLRTRVLVAGRETDEYSVSFGFREVVVDARRGLFINGRHYKIKGLCGHADCGLMGKAVPDNIHRYKVRLMREMGANGYRTSHYPQSAALMDALDENGFIVMDEVRWFESSEESLSQLEMLIKRDRNRPSVMFWSLGNEEPLHVSEQGRRIAKRMLAAVKRLDLSRPVMTAINVTPDKATVCDELDMIGVNYCWEAYTAVHEKYPDKPIVSSENCATGTTRGWYFDDDPERAFISAYDHDSSEQYKSREYTWKFISERDWMLGGYQWIAFEHRGEAKWPRLCSQSGAIDLFLQKKDAFFQNRSHWSDEAMVHLLPHWNWRGREGEIIRVLAYTNAERLELFLNGVSQGEREIEKYGHGEWEVPYEAGELRVIAYRGGTIVAEDVRVTSKDARRLALRLENDDVRANGEDIAIFSCYVTDEDGNEVYDATPTVSFSTDHSGEIYSTGSDITDHSSIFLPVRRMRAGRISVAVKPTGSSGELRLRAESDELESAEISVKLKTE